MSLAELNTHVDVWFLLCTEPHSTADELLVERAMREQDVLMKEEFQRTLPM
jgi:hypothetical protein